MKTFTELHNRLVGLATRLDGELWDSLVKELDPPRSFPRDSAIQDLAFRDAKALAGYVPDLRHIMRANSAKGLSDQEFSAYQALCGLYNLAARLPTVLLSIPDYRENENLIDLYNGYRQTLAEMSLYLGLAEEARRAGA
ncbi:MAG: hypothetical protein LBO66_12470 [Deltaproteobacteria bacterium]|jgi:hypothetical protein|nr:hypothetical protein [Deltaproteobacteria bacterium]